MIRGRIRSNVILGFSSYFVEWGFENGPGEPPGYDRVGAMPLPRRVRDGWAVHLGGLMAKKRRKKLAGPPPGMRKKEFKMLSIKPLRRLLQNRAIKAHAVVTALQRGAVAQSTPGVGSGLSPLQEANQVANNLDRAVAALAETCPNNLNSSFVLYVKSSGR